MTHQSIPGASRWRLVFAMWFLPLVTGGVLRAALVIASWHDIASWSGVALALLLGVLLDAAVACIAIVPIAAVIIGSRASIFDHRWARRLILGAWIFGLSFMNISEWFFWDEFTARLNHIALDYLIYPHEVFVNIWESYHIPLIVGSLAAIAGALAWPIAAWTFRSVFVAQRRRELAWLLPALGIAAGIIWVVPEHPHGNRIVDGIAENGVVQLARAFSSANLDYDQFYRAPAADVAERDASAWLGLKVAEPGAPPNKHIGPASDVQNPYDVLVVFEESLGCEFVASVGGLGACTPQLDRWSQHGLLLTNLIANGNRTVRGLEGVLCSFLPVPPDSIVKRDKSENLASLGTILTQHGYRSEFFYGGVGRFDNMGPFALANGWQVFHDDPLVGESPFPPNAFRTAWGVADGPVFDQLLLRQREAQAKGERLFSTLLTVSNHKPFLVPGWLGVGPGTKQLAIIMIIGGVLLALTVVSLWFGRQALGLMTIGGIFFVLWLGFGIYAYVRLGAYETRETAVKYADHALGQYLDQAKVAGILDHTVVLVVGDHGARVYGSQAMPLDSYRIPGLFLTPDTAWTGRRLDRLCSQVDLAPTLLSFAGLSVDAPFFGDDLTHHMADPGRAFVQHNRDIGVLTDHALVVLGLPKTRTCYRRPDAKTMQFIEVPAAVVDADPHLSALAHQTESAYAFAYALYQDRRWRLPERLPEPATEKKVGP